MLLNTLEFLLKSRLLNIKELSSKSDIYYETLIKLVNDKNKMPSGETLNSLCKTLQTNPGTISFHVRLKECYKQEFLNKSYLKQDHIIDCCRYFVVLEANYFVDYFDLDLPFDMVKYKNLTDCFGRKYHTLNNLFLVMEYFEGFDFSRLTITDELAQPAIEEYDSEVRQRIADEIFR